jgi:hypothetical protein
VDCIFLDTTNSRFLVRGEAGGIGIAPFIAAIWRYLVASLLASDIGSVIIRGRAGLLAMPSVSGALARILIVSALLWALYLSAVILLFQGYSSLFQVVGMLKEMLPQSMLSKLYSETAVNQDLKARDGAEEACEISAGPST